MIKISHIFIVCLLSIIASCTAPQENNTLIPVEDFFRNPEKTSLQLSPDGECIAYLQPYENRLNLFVLHIATKEVIRLTSDNSRGIMKFFWANNDQVLFLRDKDGDEFYHLFSVKKDGTGLRDLTPFDKVKIRFYDNRNSKNDEIFIGFNKRNPEFFDLYKMNVKTGAYKMIAENPGNISYWQPDHNGRIRLAVATDGVNEHILFRRSENENFKKILTLNFRETLYPICFAPDNHSIYAISNVGRDKTALVEFDLETALEKRIIFAHPDVDINYMTYSLKSKQPLYCSYTTWKNEVKYLTEGAEDLNRRVREKLGGKLFTIVNFDQDENKFLVKTYSDKSLGTYYLYDLKQESLLKIADVSPWIRESEMADMKPVSLKSRDGLTINGYLTLPKGQKAKDLPLIVNPHGGPWYRDKWGFSPETQFLASRGYAVLQVNYRGSDGYGKAFWEAGFKEIGRKTQDDITDGVRMLIAKGIVDSTRIGIFGFSFGGYFALNGVIKDPGLYQCAVSYCGLTNLFAYVKDIPPYYKQYLKMTYEMFGNPEKDAEYFRENSPAFHADQVKVPLLIAQGAKDSRVSAEEVSLFVKSLKKQGQKVNYILLDNEGHGFQNEENKIMFYSEMEQFFYQHLGSK